MMSGAAHSRKGVPRSVSLPWAITGKLGPKSIEQMIHRRDEWEARFWGFVSKSDIGCWEWTGDLLVDGYGRFARRFKVHRLSYELEHGAGSATGLMVCHRCDNRRCLRPSHLFLGTAADNVRDMHEKGRDRPPRGEDSALAILTAAQVSEIVSLGDLSARDVAARFGVTVFTIDRIRSGRTWRSVTGLSPIRRKTGPRRGGGHSADTIAAGLALVDAGVNHSETARRLGVSRGRVRVWVNERDAHRFLRALSPVSTASPSR